MSTQPLRERLIPFDAGNIVRRRAEAVQHLAAFADIPLTDCIGIVSIAQERRFPRRQIIFFEGEPVRHVVLLVSGCVKTTQLGANGNEAILRLNGPGDVLGSVSRRGRSEHHSTACAVQPSRALIWETSEFEAMAERYPTLERNITRMLERRLTELEVRFREISTERVAPRLGSELVRLMEQVGKNTDGHVEISLSRRELAQLTGTTLFTVSRLLRHWRARGIVGARRDLVLVHNVPALLEVARQES